MIESFKIKIANETQHKIVQETLFSNGAAWREGQETVYLDPIQIEIGKDLNIIL